jgi:hypothetical protein
MDKNPILMRMIWESNQAMATALAVVLTEKKNIFILVNSG